MVRQFAENECRRGMNQTSINNKTPSQIKNVTYVIQSYVKLRYSCNVN